MKSFSVVLYIVGPDMTESACFWTLSLTAKKSVWQDLVDESTSLSCAWITSLKLEFRRHFLSVSRLQRYQVVPVPSQFGPPINIAL
jgi:hypothetical protein